MLLCTSHFIAQCYHQIKANCKLHLSLSRAHRFLQHFLRPSHLRYYDNTQQIVQFQPQIIQLFLCIRIVSAKFPFRYQFPKYHVSFNQLINEKGQNKPNGTGVNYDCQLFELLSSAKYSSTPFFLLNFKDLRVSLFLTVAALIIR